MVLGLECDRSSCFIYQLAWSFSEMELSSFIDSCFYFWDKFIVKHMELYADISILGMVALKQL